MPLFLTRFGRLQTAAARAAPAVCLRLARVPARWPVVQKMIASLSLRGAIAAGIAMGISSPTWCKSSSVLAQADALFDANEYTRLTDLLRQALASNPDNAQVLWRLARALKKLADAEADKAAKARLVTTPKSRARTAVRTPRPPSISREPRQTAGEARTRGACHGRAQPGAVCGRRRGAQVVRHHRCNSHVDFDW